MRHVLITLQNTTLLSVYKFLKTMNLNLKCLVLFFFKMFITIGLQVNPYYSVTLGDKNVHVLSSHIKRCCYRHSACTVLS